VAHRLRERLYGGELIVNLRAEADPEAIDEIATETLVRATAAHTGLRSRIEHKESFRPARPSPTYRMVTA
jgi:hypothetical protein